MLIHLKLPSFLWAEAIQHSVWLRNRSYTSSLPEAKTPYKISTRIKPDLTGLLEWGSKVWVKKLDVGKLKPRALEARFVGIDDESKGYRIYWPTHRKVSIERDVYADKTKIFEPKTVEIEGENAAEKSINPPASDSLTPKPIENPLPPASIPFPHEQEAPINNKPSNDQDSTLRRGTCTRKEAGFYNENRLQKAAESAHIAAVDNELLDSGGAEYALYVGNQDWFNKLVEKALIENPEDILFVHEALNETEKEK